MLAELSLMSSVWLQAITCCFILQCPRSTLHPQLHFQIICDWWSHVACPDLVMYATKMGWCCPVQCCREFCACPGVSSGQCAELLRHHARLAPGGSSTQCCLQRSRLAAAKLACMAAVPDSVFTYLATVFQSAPDDTVQDWHDGKIPYYTLPPERGSVVKGSAEVVSSWAKEFDADQVGCPPPPFSPPPCASLTRPYACLTLRADVRRCWCHSGLAIVPRRQETLDIAACG